MLLKTVPIGLYKRTLGPEECIVRSRTGLPRCPSRGRVPSLAIPFSPSFVALPSPSPTLESPVFSSPAFRALTLPRSPIRPSTPEYDLTTNMLNLNMLSARHLLAFTILVLLGCFVKDTSAVPVSSERFVAERSANETRLAKRFDGARFTFYDAGLGACGEVNSNSDFVSACAMFDRRFRNSHPSSFLSLHSFTTSPRCG